MKEVPTLVHFSNKLKGYKGQYKKHPSDKLKKKIDRLTDYIRSFY